MIILIVAGAAGGRGGGALVTGLKKVFQNKLHNSADQNTL